MGEPVILEALRAPVGRRNGAYRERRPEEVYGEVLKALVSKVGIDPVKIEDVPTGCVTEVGPQGGNVGRMAVLAAGFPVTVPSITMNRACGSAQQAVHFAAQAIAAGDMKYAIGGGVEFMSQVGMGADMTLNGEFNVNFDLFQKFEMISMGEAGERIAEKYKFSRRELDEFAFTSQSRAANATKSGYFKSQIVPMQGLDKAGNAFTLDFDEGIRMEPDLEKMLMLPPSFRPEGVVTAGNSSQISDGTGAVLVADRETAIADGFKPRARFRARVVVGGDPSIQLLEVIPATRKALERSGLSLDDIGVIEINEAFASVVLAWARELNPDMERVNPNGGAIAHGHPLGGTGAILMSKLLHEMERRDVQFGLQVMCIGGGMSTCTILERI